MDKIKNFIISHPIWSMFILGFFFDFLYFMFSDVKTIGSGYILSIIIFAIIAPFIRRARSDKKKKEEADYLAKQIAKEILEQSKTDPKEKYRKYHEGQPPSFEEWKAQREQERKNSEAED